MKLLYSLLIFLFISVSAQAQLGFNGHTPTNTLTYVPSGYSFQPTMRQNVASPTSSAVITANSAADAFINFIYDTSGKTVYLVYTTNGTLPTKTNGTPLTGSFSNYQEPNRTWKATISAGTNIASTTINYVLYISDNSLASAFARINASEGYQTSWTENAGSGFSYVVAGALPVTLTSFNAQASSRMATLDWATVAEQGNAYFDVERSKDAQTFERVGRVEGRGIVTSRQVYNFTDESPSLGANYYRLRQVDIDGRFSYSPVRAVQIRSNGELAILGNPASEQLGVAGLESGSVVDLLDLTGQLRTRQSVTDSRLQVDVRDLPSGTYLLRIAEPTGVQTKRVLVVH